MLLLFYTDTNVIRRVIYITNYAKNLLIRNVKFSRKQVCNSSITWREKYHLSILNVHCTEINC